MAPRHRTLEATLDWSYRLLSPAEQSLFTELSVFSGGWTFDAADHITTRQEDTPLVETLWSLVDKSLAQLSDGSAGPRYRFLEPVRQYAAGLLDATGQRDDIERRHAAYYAALAESAFPQLIGPDEDRWTDRLDADVDNLRVALAWHLRTGETSAGQLMAGALYRFWAHTWRLSDGRTWRDRFVTADLTPGSTRARALLAGSGVDGAGLEEAVELYTRYGPAEELSIALNNLGSTELLDGRWQSASEFFDKATEVGKATGTYTGFTSGNRAWIKAYYEHDLDGAARLAEDALHTARTFGSPLVLQNVLADVGMIEANRGRYDRAYQALEEALSIETRPGAWNWYAGLALRSLAEVALLEGNLDRATRYIDQHREQLATARFPDPQRQLYALFHTLWIRGLILIQQSRHRRGVTLLAAEATQRRSDDFLRGVRPPPQQSRIEQGLDTARRALGDQEYSTAWADGAALTLKQAIQLAVQDHKASID